MGTARQPPPGNGQLPSGRKRPFSLKESVGQKTRAKAPFPDVEGKERALAVSCQEPTTGKTMATGIPGEGPWLRLNPETGTAPEKGQSRTSRAGANTSLPGNTRRKRAACGASSVFWYFFARQKSANRFLGAKQNRNVQCTKGKFPALRGCPPGISETSAPELALALRERTIGSRSGFGHYTTSRLSIVSNLRRAA